MGTRACRSSANARRLHFSTLRECTILNARFLRADLGTLRMHDPLIVLAMSRSRRPSSIQAVFDQLLIFEDSRDISRHSLLIVVIDENIMRAIPQPSHSPGGSLLEVIGGEPSGSFAGSFRARLNTNMQFP